jgi:hypothetical protein
MNMEDTPIVSRRCSAGERRYREEKRLRQRENRAERKAATSEADKAAYLAYLKERFFTLGKEQAQ